MSGRPDVRTLPAIDCEPAGADALALLLARSYAFPATLWQLAVHHGYAKASGEHHLAEESPVPMGQKLEGNDV